MREVKQRVAWAVCDIQGYPILPKICKSKREASSMRSMHKGEFIATVIISHYENKKNID